MKFLENLLKAYSKEIYDQGEFLKNKDNCKDQFHFRNGYVILSTGKFKQRTSKDYITKILDYDYKPINQNVDIIKKVLKMFINIFNDEEETFNTMMSYLGYCLTGEVREQCLMFIVGEKAQNGKSTIFEIARKCFPIYVKNISSGTFNDNYQKSHKVVNSKDLLV